MWIIHGLNSLNVLEHFIQSNFLFIYQQQKYQEMKFGRRIGSILFLNLHPLLKTFLPLTVVPHDEIVKGQIFNPFILLCVSL